MARHSIWTRAKHPDGLERPHSWEPLAAQKNHEVAPAPQTGKGSVCEMFYPRPVKEEMGRITCRPSTSHQQRKRAYELEGASLRQSTQPDHARDGKERKHLR